MRARLRTAERVCGRDLGKARDRLELWLALSLDEFVPPGRRNRAGRPPWAPPGAASRPVGDEPTRRH